MPHCGAKNKPKRTTCRACGKSPDEAVVGPWYAQPRQLGIVGLVVLTFFLIVSALFSVDLGHRSPGLATLDTSLRLGSAEGQVTVNGQAVQLAMCYR